MNDNNPIEKLLISMYLRCDAVNYLSVNMNDRTQISGVFPAE
jgi:hypothetical protein